jgi:DNA-binding SARP family transcriptional activator
MMRCYLARGERTQALRQYRLCQQFLQAELETEPEPATTLLYETARSTSSPIG